MSSILIKRLRALVAVTFAVLLMVQQVDAVYASIVDCEKPVSGMLVSSEMADERAANQPNHSHDHPEISMSHDMETSACGHEDCSGCTTGNCLNCQCTAVSLMSSFNYVFPDKYLSGVKTANHLFISHNQPLPFRPPILS